MKHPRIREVMQADVTANIRARSPNMKFCSRFLRLSLPQDAGVHSRKLPFSVDGTSITHLTPGNFGNVSDMDKICLHNTLTYKTISGYGGSWPWNRVVTAPMAWESGYDTYVVPYRVYIRWVHVVERFEGSWWETCCGWPKCGPHVTCAPSLDGK
eukprot:35455-Prorocentrum_minimum.AAC.3